MTVHKFLPGVALLALSLLAGCDLMSSLAPTTDWVAQARNDIKAHPVIVDHIGEIQSFTVDDDASGRLWGENDFVFDIKGSKGAGTLTATCVTVDEFTEDVTVGYLTINGERFDLEPGQRIESEVMMDEFAAQVQADLQDNPVLADKLGAISSFQVNLTLSNELDGADVYAFDVVGEKGRGVITATCVTVDENTEDVTSGSLKLSNGEELDLFPSSAP